jgi:hypothetical protein
MASLMNTVLSCLFFSPIMPVAIPIAVIGIWLNYFITKFMLINWHKKPKNIGGEIVNFFANILPIMVIVWASGMLWFF